MEERTISMKMQKCAACIVSAAVTMILFSGCSKENAFETAVIGENSFVMTLYPDIAPITCENFQSLVNDGFYDGLTFHRVVDGFIAQGGDPNGDGTGGSEKTITGEFSTNGVNNTLSHVRGTVSMARADDYNSATSQFFICYDDLSYLDGSYAAFGSITEGMEVIDGFLDVPRTVGRMGEISVPETPIVIEHAAEIEADTAGNPRIQFLIRIDSEDAESTESTEAEAGTEATEETVVATAVEETVATEEETVDAVG
jgi:peptidyl-prolyl cis-trans isomerase B (cyclophilin B)